MPKCVSNDLSLHFILIHPARQLGIVEWGYGKRKARTAYYTYDAQGNVDVGRFDWKPVTDGAKGKVIVKKNRFHYLHDFVKPPVLEY